MSEEETWRWVEATEQWVLESEVAKGVEFVEECRTAESKEWNERRQLEARICRKLAPATVDELAVVEMFVAKVMGEGRREYGPLDLGTDTRTVEDLLREAVDEILLDGGFYLFTILRLMEKDLMEKDRKAVCAGCKGSGSVVCWDGQATKPWPCPDCEGTR